MKKRFITAAAMAAVTATVLLNGCTSPQTSSLVSSQTETESPATEQVQTQESTKGIRKESPKRTKKTNSRG